MRVLGEVTADRVAILQEADAVFLHELREAGYYVTSNKGKNDFNYMFDYKDLYDDLAGNMGLSDMHWRKRLKDKPFFAQIQLRGGKNSGKVAEKTDPDKMKEPAHWASRMVEGKVTTWHTAPAMLKMLVEHLEAHPAPPPPTLECT